MIGLSLDITPKDLKTLNAEGVVRLEKHPYCYVKVEED